MLRDGISERPKHISVIAHSFGTYCITKALEKEHDIILHRLILCGSIVPDFFEWEKYKHRIASDLTGDWQIINDCGMKDILPVFAKSVTWGYGSSGRFGFGHQRVKDRFFNFGHSDFFNSEHVRNKWLPYLAAGHVAEGLLSRPTTSWLVSLLTVAHLRFVVPLIIIFIIFTWDSNIVEKRFAGYGNAATKWVFEVKNISFSIFKNYRDQWGINEKTTSTMPSTLSKESIAFMPEANLGMSKLQLAKAIGGTLQWVEKKDSDKAIAERQVTILGYRGLVTFEVHTLTDELLSATFKHETKLQIDNNNSNSLCDFDLKIFKERLESSFGSPPSISTEEAVERKQRSQTADFMINMQRTSRIPRGQSSNIPEFRSLLYIKYPKTANRAEFSASVHSESWKSQTNTLGIKKSYTCELSITSGR